MLIFITTSGQGRERLCNTILEFLACLPQLSVDLADHKHTYKFIHNN